MQTSDYRPYRLTRCGAAWPTSAVLAPTRPAALRLVTLPEMDALRQALRHGKMPLDLAAKLARLRGEDLRERYLQQNSALFIGLWTAAETGAFVRAQPEEREQLLRMLAYVRKDDDAIPDTWPGGFHDDHDLMRWVCGELRSVLESYKTWHLTHRVPLLWPAAGAHPVSLAA